MYALMLINVHVSVTVRFKSYSHIQSALLIDIQVWDRNINLLQRVKIQITVNMISQLHVAPGARCFLSNSVMFTFVKPNLPHAGTCE